MVYKLYPPLLDKSFKELRKMKVQALLGNKLLFDGTHSYKKWKINNYSNISHRLLMYSIFDLNNNNGRAYHESVVTYILQNKEMLKEKLYFVCEFPSQKKMVDSMLKKSKSSMQSAITHSILTLNKILFTIYVRRNITNQHYTRYLILNQFGKDLKWYYDNDWLF